MPKVRAIPVVDRASGHELNAALQRASMVVYTCDADLRYTWMANPLPGLTAAEMIGRRDDELLPPEFAGPIMGFKREAVLSGRPATMEFPLQHRGETLFYEFRAEPLRDPAGATTGLSVLVIDITARKRAELRASESAERYRALAAATREGIIIHDSHSIVEVNEVFCALHGTTREQAIGRPAHHYLTPESRRIAAAAGAFGSTEPYEVTAVREDGTTFSIEARGQTLSYQGRTMRVATIRDLSERLRAEEVLRRSETRYRSLVQAAATFVWSLSPEGAMAELQPEWSTWSDFTGQTPEQYLGRGWMDALHPDDIEDIVIGWCAATKTGSFYQGEGRVRRHDGVYRDFLIRGAPVFDENNRLVEWVVANIDVSAQKAAEAALRDSEERFRGYAEASLDVLWMTDAETGQLEYLSPAYEEVWGEPREVSMRHPTRWEKQLHHEDRTYALDSLAAASRGERSEVEYRIIRPDGSMRWIRDTAFPVLGPDGHVRRAAGLARDITRIKENEERQKLLLGELNHRVKNTLATVQSIARQTLRSAESSEVLQARFEDRLLALSKTHNLLTNENWEHASLRDLLEQELSPYGPGRYCLCGEGDVRVAPRAVVALGMAVHELTTNAAKYGALSAAAGYVTVTWTLSSPGLRRLRLEWTETGGPTVAAQPTRRGFGSRLLERGVTAELGGSVTLDFAPAGLQAVIEIPLDPNNTAALVSR